MPLDREMRRPGYRPGYEWEPASEKWQKLPNFTLEFKGSSGDGPWLPEICGETIGELKREAKGRFGGKTYLKWRIIPYVQETKED